MACGSRATAIPAIPAPTSSTCRGATRPSPCRPSPIRASCSSGSSVPARPANAGRAWTCGASSSASILDFVRDDTRALEQQLGGHDQKKLDEYLSSVREIERRLERAEQFKDFTGPAVETPAGIPGTFREHIELMFDMMILAFQTDSTRIATFLLANEGSNRTFPDVNIAEGHHNLSHHRNKKETLDKIADIDRWYVLQFARFLEKMDAVKDIDGKSLASQFDDRLWQRQWRRQRAIPMPICR